MRFFQSQTKTNTTTRRHRAHRIFMRQQHRIKCTVQTVGAKKNSDFTGILVLLQTILHQLSSSFEMRVSTASTKDQKRRAPGETLQKVQTDEKDKYGTTVEKTKEKFASLGNSN